MLRRFSLPLALILLALVATVALLLVFLPAEEAEVPEDTLPTGESQTQAAALTSTETQASVVAPNVADGFQDRNFVDAAGATALAFLPDGRLLVTGREGRIRLAQGGATNTTVALDISSDVCSNSERGMLGLAVDPDFGTAGNNHVYVYYSFEKFGTCPEKAPGQNNPVNRVSRFQMNGDTIVRGSEDVLINNIPSPNGNHNAGDLHFGKDGKLYVSTGDGACDYAQPAKCQPENDASRDRNVLLGKILRINADGTVPADNPYASDPNGVPCGALTTSDAAGGSAAERGKICTETYAWGFRNPFRFALDPDARGVSLRANDVGGSRIEEVNQVQRGGDYGWNCREGSLVLNTQPPCPGKSMTGPINQYGHNTGCSSITGGAFVPNDAGWPTSYHNAYLFGDYVCGKIFKISPKTGGGYTRTVFGNSLQGGPVSFAFGPDGALYYTTYAGGGQVRRIAFVNNKSPIADIKAAPTDPDTGEIFGPTPLTVSFDGSGSSDPEGQSLTYEWDFDYTNDTFTQDATGANAAHPYDTAGAYTAALRVTDDRGNTGIAKKTVYAGNTAPPQPVIEAPASGATFRVGKEISLSGSATDADGFTLKWEVVRHHTAPNAHTHTYKTVDGANATFTAPSPEDLRSTNPDGNYIEIRLTATDSQGLSKTVSQDLKPLTTGVRFATKPTGLYLYVNGERFKAPRTLLSWEGANLNVYAPPQTIRGRRYVFRAWSDGRGKRHTIVTPAEPKTYTATFRQR